MKADPATISEDAAYHWMASTIVPRPIAWVSTLNEDGSANLAPFSFFTGVTSDPPLCLICVSRHSDDRKKDTLLNVERTGELVIHVVNDALAAQMNLTARAFPYGVDEFDQVGLTKAPCERVRPPRIVESPVAMECRLEQIVEVGRSGGVIVVAEILLWHVQDDLIVNGRLDLAHLDAVGRMAGASYTRTRDLFELRRPR
jgi:flavin reductase (DIM6/NTAB) family NADH-FMN oxidoreductase RutF